VSDPSRSERPDGRGGPHVFVDDLERPKVSPEDRHHLERVLRLRAGDELTVGDGAGGWRRCRFGAELETDGPVHHQALPMPPLTIGFALVKGERPELVVQKLTELGVDRIVPFAAERSVVRWRDQRAAGHIERLRRVAREAAMQSRRCWLPDVSEPMAFVDAASAPRVALAERGGEPPSLEHPTILIGPEGGWTDDERARVGHHVSLSDQVLRVETAAIAAAALLAALRQQLV
jgi:16S rRNA (uracil1498-N3)-methyltransferase